MKRKQMKILIAIAACVCLFLCVGICMLSVRTVRMSGVRVNWVDFNRAYCGPAEDRIPVEECGSYSAIEARLSDVTVTDDGISMILTITDDRGEETTQTMNGVWRNGINYEVRGENSVTAVFEQTTDAPLYPLVFNCYNDSEFNNLLLGQVPDEAPHLKFYLQDRSGNIILLEGKLPGRLCIRNDASWETDDSDETALIRYVNGLTGAPQLSAPK
ncbi:MAG: hypothetical protein IJY28_02300 [Clostridia bacterium]|nr:hypothetical protein [Clostridia bacterium]